MAIDLKAVLTLVDNATKPLMEVRKTLEKVERSSGSYTRSMNSASNAGVSGFRRATTALSGLGGTTNSVTDRFRNMANSVGSSVKSGIEAPILAAKNVILGLGAAAGVAGGASLFNAGMDRLSAIEGAKVSLNVMMNGDTERVNGFMDDVLAFAKETPFAFPQLAQTSKNLIAFGMEQKDVIKTMTAIGDAAAGTGKGAAGLDQIAGAFGQMQVASTLSLEEINRLQDGGVPALQILANKGGVSVDALRSQISKGAVSSKQAVKDLVDGIENGTTGINGATSSMAGIMKDSKKTWVGSIDSMKSAVSSTMATMLDPIKPKLQAGMAWFGDTFKKIPDFLAQVKDALSPVIEDIGASFSSLFSSSKPVGDYIQDNFIPALKAFGDNWPTIKEGIIGATSAFISFKAIMTGATIIMTVTKMINAYKVANVGATTAQALFNGVLLANPIGLIIAGIAALIGIIVVLVRNWDTVTKKTKQFWKAIGGGSGVIRIIMGPLGILIGAAIDLAKNWDSTKSVWENVWGAMKRSAAATVNSVIGGINEMIKVINKIPGVNIPVVARVNWGTEDSAYSDNSSSRFGAQAIGYAGGLARVPYDGMPARLHANEMVLTSEQADAYRNGEGVKGVNITIQNMTVRKDSDIEAIANVLAEKVHSARGRGA